MLVTNAAQNISHWNFDESKYNALDGAVENSNVTEPSGWSDCFGRTADIQNPGLDPAVDKGHNFWSSSATVRLAIINSSSVGRTYTATVLSGLEIIDFPVR